MVHTATPHVAGLVFDALAADYDESFTRSGIGRAQREAVWRTVDSVFQGKLSILELNCGTGEDAIYLASRGHRVLALDASREMIACASRRKDEEAPDARIDLHMLPTEELGTLPSTKFDAIFSNFSGLNCVADLHAVASALALRTVEGGPALFCMSTRVCLWETTWHLLSGQFRKAFRRWSGRSTAHLRGMSVTVYYPTVRAIEKAFAPWFELRSATGIGILVPPSYVEPWMRSRPVTLRVLSFIDRLVCHLPIFRSVGDHVLLHFVRIQEVSA